MMPITAVAQNKKAPACTEAFLFMVSLIIA